MRPAELIRAVAVLALAFLAGVVALPAAAVPAPSPAPRPAAAQLIVLSNSSPNVSVIDTGTRRVVRTADLPGFTSWTWNDDHNFFDGRQLWLGMQNPDTKAVEVIALDLGTLRVTHRIPLGTDTMTLYLSRGSKEGLFYVGKMGSGQVVAIDPKAAKVLHTWTVPVNGGVVCDIDVAVGPDGVERVFYPTWKGDTVVSLDPRSGRPLKIVAAPKGGGPWMNTAAPDGRLWVQWEANTNGVLDPATLAEVKRLPVGKQPTNASFSPDGRYAYITYLADTVVTVVDAESLAKVQDVPVGTDAVQAAVDPNGKFVYAIATKEASVVVIDTATWKPTKRIPLGTNPSGIFLRPPAP
jgi:YVTN family beta-propeller protein